MVVKKINLKNIEKNKDETVLKISNSDEKNNTEIHLFIPIIFKDYQKQNLDNGVNLCNA